MSSMGVFPVSSLSSSDQSCRELLTPLLSSFISSFGCHPSFVSLAPGRVNLIGEHIDYCGYAVLPMALDQSIMMACCVTESGMLRLSNTNPAYRPFTTSTSAIQISREKPEWFDYFQSGFKGVSDHIGLSPPLGMDIVVSGAVPPNAGLSSSSALVCCAGLATMFGHKASLSPVELADICAASERFVGTQGGGMDQAISCTAQKGTAKLIEFNPLRVVDVRLPAGAAFVISHSCVEMNKAATAVFNTRVVECRLAAQVLAQARGLDWRLIRRLGDVQQALGLSLAEMVGMCQSVLRPEPYSKQDVCRLLSSDPDELARTSLSANTLHVDEFRLQSRALHVYSEADRVLQFHRICESSSDDEALVRLGALMNESHASCSVRYECSCDELDRLTEICRSAGALGSRLTGAGWGGCAVSLVPTARLDEFIRDVKDKFYAGDAQREAYAQRTLFATRPAAGASILLVDNDDEGVHDAL